MRRNERRVCGDVPPSGGGGGGQRGLPERLLPRRQRVQRRVRALDLAVRLDRVVRHLGKIHDRAEREIRQRQRVAGDESFALELTVEHLGGAVEAMSGSLIPRNRGLATYSKANTVQAGSQCAMSQNCQRVTSRRARSSRGRRPASGFFPARYCWMALDSHST